MSKPSRSVPLADAGAGSQRATRPGHDVLGTFIDALSWDESLQRVEEWSRDGRSRYICICNAHSVVTARGLPALRDALDGADMATPDGAPIAWMLRRLGFPLQERINGPDLMWRYCKLAEQTGTPVFLFGSTLQTLRKLEEALVRDFPALRLAGSLSPPFRAVSAAEDAEQVEAVNRSGAGVLFVSLGCPKQEIWMAQHRGRIHATMLGVGAAFDFHAGTQARAPAWMRTHGMEWLHRLVTEPRRLWRRYLVTNTLFVFAAARQLLRR